MNVLKNPNTIAIYLGLATIVFRLLIETFEWDWGIRIFPIILFILIVSFVGIRKLKSNSTEKLNFVSVFQSGMRPAMFYVIIISIFTFVFYQFLSPHFFERVMEIQIEENVAKLKATNTSDADIELYIKGFRENKAFKEMFKPFTWTTMTLFALMILTAFYTFILTLVERKFPNFFQW